MERFKKGLRLLTEKLGGKIEHGMDNTLRLSFSTGSAHLSSLSHDEMHCKIELDGATFAIRTPKAFVYDIASRLATPHLAPMLRTYKHGELLTLQNYINEEQGGPMIKSLRKRIADDPSVVTSVLGGNRILAEYYHGVLVLSDDLCEAATNVVDLSPRHKG